MAAIESLRIGTVPFANVMPLDFYLPEILPEAEFTCAVPSKLAQWLAKGKIDVALLSSIQLLQHPEYSYIPGMGICSNGPVASVCLYTHKEPQELKTVGLDNNSLTSNMLAKILFEEYWEHTPHYNHYTPPVEEGLKKADGAIAIGDSTFAMLNKDIKTIDLGEIWKAHTKLPFVYAFWVTREGLDPKEIVKPFKQAKKLGMEHLKQLSVVCAQQRNLPMDFVYQYFTKNIHYDVGAKELRGLKCFHEKAGKFLG